MARKSNLTRRISQPPSGPIQGNIDSLIQGVSQQPPHLRVVGQGEEQINGWSSPVEGLGKRNPMRHVARILPTPVSDFYLEMMSVISGERYSVMVYPDGAATKMLITLNGTAAAVDVHGTGLSAIAALSISPMLTNAAVSGDSTSYLYNAAGNFEQKYVLINNGPIAFLLNREKVVAMDAATTAAQKNEALIFVQAVAYEISYKATLDGTALAPVITPKATDTNNLLDSSDVAKKLADEINKNTAFTAVANKYVVHVVRKDAGPFKLSLDDGRGNSMARVVQGSVTSLAELPIHAPNGYVVQVSSDPSQTVDDRYLKFTTNDGSVFGPGAWSEVAAPGIQYKLDANTMPLVIYRADRGVIFVGPADGATRTQTVGGKSYSYTFPTWGQRTAGDLKTVPTPDFVGRAIRDHVIFRGRYVVLAGQFVVFSETNDIFNFFQDTSVAITAKDPFSVLAVSEISSELNWLLPVDESILAFSQYSQFQVRPADADVLTPTTAIILRVSNIQMNPRVRPKLAGPQILFPTDEFGYSHFREYTFYEMQQRRLGMNLGGSGDICLSVPKYIKGLVTHWDVGETIDLMVCSTPTDRKTLYVYKYLFSSGGQALTKSQASWSKFRFNGDVRWMKFMDNELWLVLTYGDGTYSVRLTSDELENAEEVQVHLDRLLLYPECNAIGIPSAAVGAAYDADTNRTTFTLPYQLSSKGYAVVRYTNNVKEGLLLGAAESGNTIVCDVPGDWSNTKVAFGEEYEFSYEFTAPYVPAKDQARQRIVGKQDGRTQLLHFTLHHHNTGRYNIRVKRQNRMEDSVHWFRARFLNVMNNRLGTETSVLESGQYRVPIYSQNDKCRILVESKSWLPVTITGASWEGSYSNRAKGMN
jgi:hypothetical protein